MSELNQPKLVLGNWKTRRTETETGRGKGNRKLEGSKQKLAYVPKLDCRDPHHQQNLCPDPPLKTSSRCSDIL